MVMIEKAYAKVNLALNVFEKNENNYHDLESIMLPLQLHDTIEIAILPPENTDDFITCDDYSLKVVKYNLCHKAIDVCRKRWNFKEKFRVVIHKRIFIQSGLGGGSAALVIQAPEGVQVAEGLEHGGEGFLLLPGLGVPLPDLGGEGLVFLLQIRHLGLKLLVLLQPVLQGLQGGVGGGLQVVQGLPVGAVLHEEGHEQQQEGGGEEDHQVEDHRGAVLGGPFVLGLVLQIVLLSAVFAQRPRAPFPRPGT